MKDVFNLNEIHLTANLLKRQSSDFDQSKFIEIASDDLNNRELKDRANQIYLGLQACLPADFPTAAALLNQCLLTVENNQEIGGVVTTDDGVAGWMILPFSQYIGIHGQQHIELAMSSLAQMTQRFSSEFGIRFLLLEQAGACLTIMESWCSHPCHHVRRLVSEGCRPLLPWAMQLPDIKQNPQQILPLLELLKLDSSEYVRRSVANNLNDISKHHPDLVVETCKRWLIEGNKETQKLIKHACRTLIKQGHPECLALFGFAPPKDIEISLSITSEQVVFGEQLEFEVDIINKGNSTQLLIDYVIYHQKANGKLAAKVFKWTTKQIKQQQKLTLTRRHSIKAISTRKYYPGEHQVAIQINGVEYPQHGFELVMPEQ